MIRISELRQAVLESERLDRLGHHEEAAAALEPVVRVAANRMTKEAQWWRPVYKAGGQVLDWLGKSSVGKALPGVGKDIKGLGSLGHWGSSVVNDAEVLGRGRSPWLQRSLPKGVKLSPEEMTKLDEIMRNPQGLRSDPAFNWQINNAGLGAAVPAAARGELMGGVPSELRGLFSRATTASQKAVMQDLYDAHRNLDVFKFNSALTKAVDEGLLDGPTANRMRISFLGGTQLSPTMKNVGKAMGVGYAGSTLMGTGHQIASPAPTPSLFPNPDPNAYGPQSPGYQDPSLYPSGRPTSVGTPPPQIYW